MISCAKSGNQRYPGIESHPISILRFRRSPTPCAGLDIVEAQGAEESPYRSILVRRAKPAPHSLLAADPPSIGSGGLQLPLQEGPPRSTMARPSGARGCRPGLSGCVARGFRESAADGESDCRVISGSGGHTRVRKTSPHGKIYVAIPGDSMEASGGLRPDGTTGPP